MKNILDLFEGLGGELLNILEKVLTVISKNANKKAQVQEIKIENQGKSEELLSLEEILKKKKDDVEDIKALLQALEDKYD